MAAFQTARNRDAWASIRGFLYQACLTVERWLALNASESLELERGEDIDIVSRALGADEVEAARLLEQVKLRESNVSLRSDPVAAFLANALDHQTRNPGAELTFRFLTNAQPAHERPTGLRQARGITVWEELRRLPMAERTADQRLQGIRDLLRSTSKPAEVPGPLWARLRYFVDEVPAKEFARFVGQTEFACGNGDYVAVRQRIEALLLKRRLVAAGCEGIGYWALLVKVLEVLSSVGLKLLRPEDVGSVLAGASPAAAQRISDLVARLTAWENTAQDLALRLRRQEDALQDLGAKVSGLSSQPLPPALALARHLVGEPPPLPSNAVTRRETVAALAADAAPGKWLALCGRPGLGKSVAALLLCSRMPVPPNWLRLRGLDRDQCAAVLQYELSSGLFVDGEQALFVADDLPRVTSGELLWEVLVRFASTLCSSGGTFVTTSNFRLPADTQELAKTNLTERELPPFSNDEAREYFSLSGAPPKIAASPAVAAINGIVSGHPTLLRAAATYLKAREWRFDTETVEALFTRTFTREVEEQSQRLLSETVSEEARELIYRLDLVIGTATEETVRSVTEAPPPVARAFEALTEVLDLWIQRSPGGYILSPLVKHLGEPNLLPEVRRGIASRLAHQILSRGTINQVDAMAVISYLMTSGEVDNAGWVFTSILRSIESAPPDIDDFGLLSLWAITELPSAMHLGIRLMVRGTQARVLSRRGRNAGFVLRSLEGLVKSAPPGLAFAALGAAVSAAVQPRADSAEAILRILAQVLPHTEATLRSSGEEMEWPKEVRPEELLWLVAMNVETPAALNAWTTCWSGLTGDQRRILVNADHYPVAAMAVASGVWRREGERPEQERSWEAAHAALARLESAALSGDGVLLAACALRSRIIVWAEYQDDLQKAEQAARSALHVFKHDPEALFLIRESIGRQYVLRKRWAEAHAWFEGAFGAHAQRFPVIRFFGLNAAAVAAGDTDPVAAVLLLKAAAEVALATPLLRDLDRVCALAELAIAEWRANGLAASFARWDEAVSVFLAIPDRSSEWRDVGVVVGHCLGYLSLIAESGSPPATTRDDKPYGPPIAGIFQPVPKGISARYPTGSMEAVLCAQLVLFADGVGATDRAEFWTIAGLERAAGPDAAAVRAVLYDRALPYFLHTNAFEHALLHARDFTEGVSGGVEEAERLQRQLLCVPLAIRVATLVVENAALGGLAVGECVEVLNRIADGAQRPAPWRAAAELLGDAFVRSVGARVLFAAPTTRDEVRAEWPLHGMANLLATLQVDCPLETAAAVHVNTMRTMARVPRATAMSERVLWPFVRAFWMKVMREERFRLNAPRAVDANLRGLDQSKPAEAMRTVLSAMVDDQRASISAEDRQWLATGAVT